jgi:UDP-galactopyranose mutase
MHNLNIVHKLERSNLKTSKSKIKNECLLINNKRITSIHDYIIGQLDYQSCDKENKKKHTPFFYCFFLQNYSSVIETPLCLISSNKRLDQCKKKNLDSMVTE